MKSDLQKKERERKERLPYQDNRVELLYLVAQFTEKEAEEFLKWIHELWKEDKAVDKTALY